MTEENFRELINKEVDGLISDIEKRRLHEYMKNDIEAKNFYNETIRTAELLKEVNDVEPSENLKKRILNSIDINHYAEQNIKKKERPSFIGWYKNLNPGFGYSFAAGVIIGLLIYSMFLIDIIQKEELNSINFYGTIGIPESANNHKLDEVSLDLPGVTGTVKYFKFDNIIWFDISIITSEQCKMAFIFDQTRTSFTGFKPLDHINSYVESEKEKLNIIINENSHFLLLFTQKSTEHTQINLEIAHTTQTPFTYTFQARSENK